MKILGLALVLAACSAAVGEVTIEDVRQDVSCGIEGCVLTAQFTSSSPVQSCNVDGTTVTIVPDGTKADYYLYVDGLNVQIDHSVGSEDRSHRFSSITCY